MNASRTSSTDAPRTACTLPVAPALGCSLAGAGATVFVEAAGPPSSPAKNASITDSTALPAPVGSGRSDDSDSPSDASPASSVSNGSE